MTNFQTIGLAVAVLLLLATAVAAGGRAINRRAAFAWSVLWLATGISIARPSLTIVVAHFLGIGRGADLVFYCAILAMFIGFFVTYVRLKRLDRQITILVREAALSSVHRNDQPPGRSESDQKQELTADGSRPGRGRP